MERFWHGVSLLLSGLIGACSSDGKDYGTGFDCHPPDTPSYLYEIDGRVTQAGTSYPIEGIEVSFMGRSATTDERGEFSLFAILDKDCVSGCQVTAKDIDGADNGGEYAEASAEFTTEDSSRSTHEISDVHIQMKRLSR